MNEDFRNKDFEEENSSSNGEDTDKQKGASASRARNQTVILTPEITDQVRALLNKDEGKSGGSDPLSDILPPLGWDAPASASGSHAPSSRAQEGSASGSLGDSGRTKKTTGKFRQLGATSQSSQPSPSVASSTTVVTPVAATPESHAHVPTSAQMHSPTASVSASQGVRSSKATKAKLIGFLVSYDKVETGEVYELRVGRWLMTSRPTEHGDYILINDETISPLHAILRVTKEGKVQVLDQLSEFGTGVTRHGEVEEEEVSGTMVTLDHGDMIRLGSRHFIVCEIPAPLKA